MNVDRTKKTTKVLDAYRRQLVSKLKEDSKSSTTSYQGKKEDEITGPTIDVNDIKWLMLACRVVTDRCAKIFIQQVEGIRELFDSKGHLLKDVSKVEKIIVVCFYDHDWPGTRTELFDLIRTTASSICTRLEALHIDMTAWWSLEEELMLLRILHKTPYNLNDRQQAVELSRGLPRRSLYSIDVYLRDRPIRMLSKIIKAEDLNDAVEILSRIDQFYLADPLHFDPWAEDSD